MASFVDVMTFCLVWSDVPVSILSSRRDFAFVLFYKTFWAGWRVTLLRSSIRNNTFYTGTPLRCIPACILSSLRDYFRTAVLCRGYATLHFASQGIGRRLGRDYACITLRSACSDIPACILSFLRDLGLSCFTRHFGRRLGITNKFVLLSACSIVLFHKTFWASPRQSSSKLDSVLGSLQNWADWKVTLLRSSIWKIHFIQGLRPSGYIPACILTSLRDYFRTAVLCRDSASLHFASQGIGRRLGKTNKFVLLSDCSKIERRKG